MMDCRKIFLVLTATILCTGLITRCKGDSWSVPLYMILHGRYSIVTEMTNLKRDFQDMRTLNDFLLVLEGLPGEIEEFLFTQWSVPETKTAYFQALPEVLQEVEMEKVPGLFISEKLANYYQRRIAKVIRKLEKDIKKFLQSNGPTDTYTLPLERICPKRASAYKIEKAITITDICTSIQKCSSVSYPYGQSLFETDATEACTSDNKCDLEKALPMMIGIFWHAMNDFIVKELCINQCITALQSDCGNFETFDRLIHEAKLLKAYTSALPQYFNNVWNDFFSIAINMRAFADLDVAMSMIQEKKRDFDLTPTMCNLIKFTKACPYADIYKEYTLIKKIQQYRVNPGLVKDIRLQSNVDHAKMVELQRDAVQHIELLGSITKLDERVIGISSYFSGLARYDEGIANADVVFLQGELDKYETNMTNIETKLKDDFIEAMGLMEATALANLAEDIALLAVKIAENGNPLGLIFGGTKPGDILEQSAKLADTATAVVKATALFISLNSLVTDSLQIGKAFNGEKSNENQITSLRALVDKIRTNEADDIGADADKFVQEYGDYTPQTDRSRLARNNALWSAYKDATCDILNGEVGIAGSVPKAVAGGMLVCEKLEGTLAQFFTLREDIFDFQFQLVDSVAKVVRGNIAKRLSQNIKGKGDVLGGSELMIGFLMTQNRLQTHSSLYCDKLEYKQLGTPIDACSTVNGLFSKVNIDSLIAYTDHSRYDQFERDVYIPTKARFQGDTGYIDLNSLGKGEKVLFKLPVNNTWLQEHRWMLAGETTVPFVESFKIFFPLQDYHTGSKQQRTTSKVTITSIAGSSVSTVAPQTAHVYVLPKGHSTYVEVYEEGYPTCSSNEIDNPYSLCNNLPNICDTSTRQAGESLLPTILSTWSLEYKLLKGSTTSTWDAPKSATNLLIRAKVKLRVPRSKRRDHFSKRLATSSDYMSEDGCCDTGNSYRASLDDRKCIQCPEKSTSKLRGLYCEIDEEPKEQPEEN